MVYGEYAAHVTCLSCGAQFKEMQGCEKRLFGLCDWCKRSDEAEGYDEEEEYERS